MRYVVLMREYIHALCLPTAQNGIPKIEQVHTELHRTATVLGSSIRAQQTVHDVWLGEQLGENHPELSRQIHKDLVPRARNLSTKQRQETQRNKFLLTRALSRYPLSTIDNFVREAEKGGKRGWESYRAAVLGAAYLDILKKKDEVMEEDHRTDNLRTIKSLVRENPDELISRIGELHGIHEHAAEIHKTGTQNIRISADQLEQLGQESEALKEAIQQNYSEWLMGFSTLSHYCPSRSAAQRILAYLKETVPVSEVPRYAKAWADEISRMETWQARDPIASQQVDRAINYLYRLHRVAREQGRIIRPQHFIRWVEKIVSMYQDERTRPHLGKAIHVLGEHLDKQDRDGEYVFENFPQHLDNMIGLFQNTSGKANTKNAIDAYVRRLKVTTSPRTPPGRRRP